jgi:hypothetical protein
MNLLRLTWPVVVAAGLTLGMVRFSQADALNVEWSGAYLLKLDSPATDVVVANPKVADVTVQAPDRLVIIGKLPGVTRLLVMNEDNVALDTQIVVSAKNRSSEVSVYRPDGANVTEGLFACSADRCTPVPGTGRTTTGVGRAGRGGGGGIVLFGPIPEEPTIDNLPPGTPGEPTY